MKLILPESFRYNKYQRQVSQAAKALFSKTGVWADKWTGWIEHPNTYPQTQEFERVLKTADYIRNNFDIVLSCGIGGSYLGARAVIEAEYGDYNTNPRRTGPEIYFIGNATSTDVISDTLVRCVGKRVCIMEYFVIIMAVLCFTLQFAFTKAFEGVVKQTVVTSLISKVFL